MMSNSEMMNRYAEVIVKIGLNVQAGQQVIIQAPIQSADLVALVVRHAYRAGASCVTPLFSDDYMTLERFENTVNPDYFDIQPTWLSDGIAQAFGDGAARLVILGETASFEDVNSKDMMRVSRSASKSKRKLYELLTKGAGNWSIASYATPEWAMKVFPDELTERDAVYRLWDAIYKVNRIDVSNPVEAWHEHNADLKRRSDYMNNMRFDALRYVGPETDLIVGLADGHVWRGGAKTTATGIVNNSNMPTEEIFTTPDRNNVNGLVKATRPLFYNGKSINGICAKFVDGRIVDISAETNEDILRDLIATDEGASRLGEVALVPNSSPVSQCGVVFYETLFDENASCHFAFGTSYSQCIEHYDGETPDDLIKRGANKSTIHVDWMVGSDKIDIYGIKDGKETRVFIKGEWA